eukprot:193935-Pyramimonas_sp.AAC.1
MSKTLVTHVVNTPRIPRRGSGGGQEGVRRGSGGGSRGNRRRGGGSENPHLEGANPWARGWTLPNHQSGFRIFASSDKTQSPTRRIRPHDSRPKSPSLPTRCAPPPLSSSIRENVRAAAKAG